MICCMSCGAYAWGGVRELSDSVCHGHAAGTGLKQQRARLLAGLFPRWLTRYKNWSVSALERPGPRDLLDLARAILERPRARAALPPARSVFPRGPPWQVPMGRGPLLARFGLTGATLPYWVDEATRRGAVEREEED